MNATPQILTLAIGAFGLVFGFSIGVGAFSHAPVPPDSIASNAAEAGSSKVAPGPGDARFASDDTAIGAVFSAWQHQNPLRRSAEVKAALNGLSADQLARMVERVAGFRDDEMQGLLVALVAQWARENSDAAAAWARPSIERFYARGSNQMDRNIMSAWDASDPERAIALALERPETMESHRLFKDAIRALAGNDPAVQIDRVAALPAGNLRDAVIVTALTEWAKTNPESALARFDRLPFGLHRDFTLTTILGEWAERDATAALSEMRRRIEAGEIGRGRGNIAGVIGAAATADPNAAREWAEGLPADLRVGAMNVAAAGWAAKDPIAALDWARSRDLQIDQSALLDGQWTSSNSILEAAMISDVSKTVDWLRKLPPSAERDRFLVQSFDNPGIALGIFDELSPDGQKMAAGAIGYRLAELGRDAAIAWTKDKVAGPARGTVITTMVAVLGRSSIEQLDALIAQYPSGTDHDAALRGAAGGLGERSAEALKYAERIADPFMREQTFRELGLMWLERDAPAARAWLSATEELDPDVKAFLIRVATEN